MTVYLDLDDILAGAAAAITPAEVLVRDTGLLESALARPRASAFGEDAYPGLLTKAAALFESLARNHALIDGNERLAWVAMRLFLVLNGTDLRVPSPQFGDEFVREVSQGHVALDHTARTLAGWVVERS